MGILTLFEKEKSNNKETESREISVFKDPFNKAKIEEITIFYRKIMFEKKYGWYANISFKDGLTSGNQKTPDCDTWEELMIHMKQIYDSLEVKS
jgi:hypothetical protein